MFYYERTSMKEDHFNFQSKLKVAASSIVSVSKFKRS